MNTSPTRESNTPSGNSSPLLQMVKARLLEFIRQPEAIFWVYVFPVLMMVALGVAFRSRSVETFDVLIVEGTQAHSVAQILEGASDFAFNLSILSADECATRLRTGKTSLVIETKGESYVYRFDPTRPGSMAAKAAADQTLQVAAGRQDVFEAEEVASTEPGGRYIDFLVPGLLGLGLMGGGLFGVGFVIVDMRIRKLLKLYMATPMKRSHFLMSLMLSRMVFMIPEVLLLLVMAWLFFGVLIFGSLWLVILLIVLGSIQFSGIGLLIASRVRTLEAASGLLNLVMLPMWTLSGVFFSYDNFPQAIHPLIKALPLTPLIDALRAAILEGEGLTQLIPELAIIMVWAIASFGVALLIFRWQD
ncbi:MAG TPA: ABC transporter permease [Pirellulaceae bacterium]|nr:ABC transporter permease [Pirellulaceae bacterium]HMO90618.1 ABC transporter permease [Pirellulaceae bacterium]HMP67803.1 ABC transporter permease [Pirellulaceae bacterium]